MDKKIIEYTLLFPVVTQLRITNSNRKNKRFRADFVMNGQHRVVHFGLKNAQTYFDGASKKKRDSYLARASKIKNKKGEYTHSQPGTANSFAYHILW